MQTSQRIGRVCDVHGRWCPDGVCTYCPPALVPAAPPRPGPSLADHPALVRGRLFRIVLHPSCGDAYNHATGARLRRVTGDPGPGEYAAADGTYTFHRDDAARDVRVEPPEPRPGSAAQLNAKLSHLWSQRGDCARCGMQATAFAGERCPR